MTSLSGVQAEGLLHGCEYVDGVQPGLYQVRPGGDGQLSAAEAVAVAALGVDVQLGRDLGVLQGQKVNGSVFDVHRVVFGLKNEGGRSLVGGMDFGIGCEALFGDGEVAGIDDDGEIGPAAYWVSRVDGGV